MSIFKNNPKINLFYSDTDSIYTNSNIDSSFIHNKQLGKLKVENISTEAVFLGPKMYCLNTIDQGFKFKIKGLKSTAILDLQDFKNLLIKNFTIKKMTTQDQIIIICILAFIAVPLGTFITIKTINKLSRAPVNALNRTADIELVDYIEPLQPLNTYYPNQFDLVNNQFSVLERISYAPTYYTGSNIPFYQSGTLPYYQSVDGININSCLENENIFNSFFTFLIFIIMFLVIIFLKMNSLYTMSLLIPFSLFEINFRDSFE
jgi:hypothetical protein